MKRSLVENAYDEVKSGVSVRMDGGVIEYDPSTILDAAEEHGGEYMGSVYAEALAALGEEALGVVTSQVTPLIEEQALENSVDLLVADDEEEYWDASMEKEGRRAVSPNDLAIGAAKALEAVDGDYSDFREGLTHLAL